MARTDFHVLAYRILAYLYKCVRDGVRPDPDAVSAEALGIGHSYWQYIMRNLALEGYVRGGFHGPAAAVNVDDMEITPAGIEYMQGNSAMARARDFLKGLKEAFPGL